MWSVIWARILLKIVCTLLQGSFSYNHPVFGVMLPSRIIKPIWGKTLEKQVGIESISSCVFLFFFGGGSDKMGPSEIPEIPFGSHHFQVLC